MKVRGLQVRFGDRVMLHGIDLDIPAGVCVAVMGDMASGKTTLLHALSGKRMHSGIVDIPHPAGRGAVCFIPRQHQFTNTSNLTGFYYQQRFNAVDAEEARTVGEEMRRAGATDQEAITELRKFGIEGLIHSTLICLSNGEHKRFQLAKAMLQKPGWLLLDNPFAGLDHSARTLLDDSLSALVESGMGILLCTGRGNLPGAATHAAVLEHGTLKYFTGREAYEEWEQQQPLPDVGISNTNKHIPSLYDHPHFQWAVKMDDVNITYQGRRILSNLCWEVRKGDAWSVSGPNGSGKSTLLSLIYADNPQAFSQDIILFDRRKGTGESIWDIKRMIGYVSPELHQHFDQGIDVLCVVASGLFDTIGLFRRLTEEQRHIVEAWMDRMQVRHLSGRSFRTLSDGEQRMVLLTRALVKDPPLLILDEPCQGLDAKAISHFNQWVDRECNEYGKTLIYVSHYQTEIPSCVNHYLELGRNA